MEQKNTRLKIAMIVLIILLGVSAAALIGTLLYNHFTQAEPATVDIPGNIITPESTERTGISQNEPMVAPYYVSPSEKSKNLETSDSPDQRVAAFAGKTKADALSLHTKQSEENKPFQAVNLFPGDSETKYYRIKVSYKGDIVVRYHADIRPGYEKLAEVLRIKVRLLGSDDFLYDGLMRDMPASLNHALYTNTKTQSELYYEITPYLDTSVGNEYMDQDLIADFHWWVEETDHLDSPQTGDMMYIWLGICLVSLSLLLIIFLWKKRSMEACDETK